jgi:two-component flavin-dependent monooxygenase
MVLSLLAPAADQLGTDPHGTAPRVTPAGVRAVARAHAAEAHATGRLHPEVVGALRRAGFARHFVPRVWGGEAGTFGAAAARVGTVAEGCASAGWLAALFTAHARLAAYLPVRGQREVWAGSPDTLIAAAVLPPRGELRRAPGGWILSGEWAPASGVEHAAWVLLSAWEESRGARRCRILALPADRVGIRPTWSAPGLRATAGHTVVVREVYVPDHLTFTRDVLDAPAPTLPGTRIAPCHDVPCDLAAPLLFSAPVLSATGAAVRMWAGEVSVGAALGSGAAPDPEPLARATGEVRSAVLLLRGAVERADQGPHHTLAVGENLRDCALAVELAVSALDRTVRAAGPRAQAPAHPLHRVHRDVQTAASHGAIRFPRAAAAYAASLTAS